MKNSFAEEYPELLIDFDYEKNRLNGIDPQKVTPHSGKRAYWKCHVCGHEWIAPFDRRANGTRCKVCAKTESTRVRIQNKIKKEGSLKDRYPELMEEWDEQANHNLGLDPSHLTIHSNENAAWICSKCGHHYMAIINNRTKGTGCGFCAGKIVKRGINDFATKNPKLLEEWNYKENEKENLYPDSLSSGSDVKVYWMCKVCGHKWKASIYSRTKMGTGCPRCTKEYRTSIPEQAIFYYINQYFSDAENSYQPDWLFPSEIDVFIPEINLGIEYDGVGFHQDLQKDEMKDSICSEHGIKLLHVREPKCPKMSEQSLCYYRTSKKTDEIDAMIKDIIELINKYYDLSIILNINFERDYNEIHQQYLTREKQRSVAKQPQLIRYWDYEKNVGIDPNKLQRYSKIKVYWKCSECGNSWRTSPSNIRGCAVCSGRKVKKGFNDLLFLNPELAEEWDYELNKNLKPDEVTIHSGKNVWWKCKKCGNSWNNKISNRSNGSGCPYCSNAKVAKGYNDLQTLYPEIADQWVCGANDESLTPSDVVPGANILVLWRCGTCNGIWKTSVNHRTQGHGCPYCSNEKVLPGFNDLATKNPSIAKEWNYKKNNGETPSNVLNASNHYYWWKCSKCGNEWRTQVSTRTCQHTGCPACAKRNAGQTLKKKVYQFSAHGELIQEYDCLLDAANAVGLTKSAIYNAIHRKNGKSGGYIWKYENN